MSLEKVEQALEFYSKFPYERGLVHVKKEDIPPPIDWTKITPDTHIPLAKYMYDKGEIAKEALVELNAYTERLESKELFVELDLNFYSMFCGHHGNDRDFEESFCKELAQAAINVIKGGKDDV